uniref:Autophagy-related protein 2 n=1 Tax=Ditylenchus dipsaci TaxID=166011 RepID=A0A915ELE5_9BILA
MGQYLKTELTSDQLEFRLADGTASVQNVKLNSDYINEILDTIGVVSLVEGYVGEISACVPWKKLMSESTIIKVSGLELTLTPMMDINMANTQDLVSSMIGSIASSMDLARSVIADESIAGGRKMRVIKVIFENIIIRIEANSDLCTGLEMQIDRMEFVDEQLEAKQQQGGSEPITQQPSSLYTVTDLNKLLHLQGIRLYTDVWSPEEQRLSTSTRMNSNDELLEQGTAPVSAEMFTSSLNFQSCYSHFSNSRTASSESKSPNSIPPNPVLFAQLFGEKHTVRIRVNNTALSSPIDNCVFNKRVDIDIFLGGSLSFFLTPSQIALLKDLFSQLIPKKTECTGGGNVSYGGKPMRPEHFQKITDQFHGETPWKSGLTGNGLSSWSGQEQFFELSQQGKKTAARPVPSESTSPTYHSFPPLHRSNSTDSDSTHSRGNQRSSASTATLVEKRPDMFTVTIRCPSIMGVITHEDPLSYDNMKARETPDYQAIRAITTEMVEQANRFFKLAAEVKIGRKRLDAQREILAELYKKDHIRIVATGTVFSLNLIHEHQQRSLVTEASMEECDVVECLQPTSIVGYKSTKAAHFDLLNLSEHDVKASKNVFTFRISNTLERQHEYLVEFNMDRCKSDIDMSIVDRIGNLLFTKPCFFSSKPNAKPLETELNPGLSDNFLSDAINTQVPSTYRVKFIASKWLINFRISVADLSEASTPYWKRNVHPEYLALILNGAFLEMPKFLPVDLISHGNLVLQCSSITSSFIGDIEFLQCTREEMTFLHADSVPSKECEDNHAVKIKFSYDTRNKALRAATLNLDDVMSKTMCKSMYESFFKPRDEDCMEGPFSKTSSYFADTKLIMAGSRDELLEFSDDCRQTTNVNLEFCMPRLNLSLPSHKFFEVMYNRFANDLALWEPKSPSLKNQKGVMDNNHLSPFNQQFVECQSYNTNPNPDNETFDDSMDEPRYASTSSRKTSIAKAASSGSHLFSLTLKVNKARVLLQTSVEHSLTAFTSQIGTELGDAELFLVYGFNEDPNLSYFYVTTTTANIYHRNLLEGVEGFSQNVLDIHNFALKHKDDVHAEAVPKDEPCSVVSDDNFAVSLKILVNPEENMKDILVALALRNTIIHLKPFTDSKMFWANQFTDFFNVIDYEVPGYVIPIVKVNLHIHLTSILLGYNHSSVLENSPMQLRLEIGSCDLNARLMAEMERFKFQCLLEDTKLWMRKKKKSSVSFTEAKSVHHKQMTQSDLSFVKVLFVGLLHFTFDYTMVNETFTGPIFELACVNDLIKVWVCSDTIVELGNILGDFINSDVGTFLMAAKTSETEANEEQDPPGAQQLLDMIHKSNMCSSFTSTVSAQANPKMQKQFSNEEESRLVQMMASAMQENTQSSIMSAAVRTRRTRNNKKETLYTQAIQEFLDEDMFEDNSFNETSPHSFSSSTNTDDEFIMINELPPKQIGGLTRMNEPRFEPDFEIVSTHVKVPDSSEEITSLPVGHPPPILKYSVKDLSLHIYLYGGNDFGDSFGSQKTYSQWDSRRESSECATKDSEGGKFRDHTVCIEAKISKISFVCEVFNATAPVLSLNVLKIGDVEVLDHLMVSEIHKVFYQHTNYEMPRRVHTPLLSIHMVEDQLREGKLKISILPIRLNFDQDTLEFLQDFLANISQNIRIPELSNHNPQSAEPVMEIPVYEKKENRISEIDFSASGQVSFSKMKDVDVASASILPDFPAPPNLDDLFSEDDVNLSDSLCATSQRNPFEGGEELSDAEEVGGTHNHQEHQDTSVPSTSAKSENLSQISNVMTNRNSAQSKETFYKEFTFSPSCRICLDYVGKRVKTDQGALVGLLIGLANLHRTELVLKELHNPKGLLGFNKCVQFAVDEWVIFYLQILYYQQTVSDLIVVQDIKTKQIPNVLGSYTPISALVHLAQGFRDLFAIPLGELRKEDGHVVRGIQQGASNSG